MSSFRWIAAATVVLNHYGAIFWHDLPRPLHGAVGGAYIWPGYFFVLSGFILTYSNFDPAKGALVTDRRRFYWSRASRIFPTYWVAWVIIAPLLIMRRLVREPTHVALGKLFVEGSTSFVGVNAWIAPISMSWNYPGWTISIELFLYVTFPFLAPRLARMRHSRLFAFALALFVVETSVSVALTKHFAGGALTNIGHLPVLHVHEFVFGIAIGLVYLRGGFDKLRARHRSSTLLQLATLAALLALMEIPPKIMIPYYVGGTIAPLLALFILGQGLENGLVVRALEWKPLMHLGRASYAFYILQEPLMSWYRIALRAADRQLLTVMQFWFFFALLTAVSVAVSRWFEEPARKAMLRLGARRT